MTIVNAPSSTSSVSSGSLILAARVKGDWTRALNDYALRERASLKGNEKGAPDGVPVHVMLDGPYGGCSVDLGRYESAMLLAGGSGASFTLSLLDDIVTRCVKLGRPGGEKTTRIEFVWCVRSYGQFMTLIWGAVLLTDRHVSGCIDWYAPILMDLAHTVANTSLDLHISIFVTCLCNPEAVPPIPNSDICILRPSVATLLQELVTPPSDNGADDNDGNSSLKAKLNWSGLGGGVAVCAAGPESLTTETRNAAAKLALTRGLEIGGVGLHTETFAV